jgi:predicted NUDIX family phosphoesterase
LVLYRKHGQSGYEEIERSLVNLKRDESVLGIPTTHFQTWGAFTGFRRVTPTQRDALLEPAQFEFRPRSLCETDPGFLQLIPYVVLLSQGQVFHYRRGASGTETRLQALLSIGIGGHISVEDAAGGSDPYRTGLQREVTEEVSIDTSFEEEFLGLIFDPRTAVGQVHLGIVHLWHLPTASATAREDCLAESGWASLEKIIDESQEFETWSQFVLGELASRSASG